MSTVAKDSEIFQAGAAAGGSAPQPEESAGRTQTVALEVPVTVNGARTVDGSDKREPFSETTKTVLIFARGAVIRLSSAVTAGQLLFLTNDSTKKEVVCQVVKSRNYSSVSGYVELEFTEHSSGFWGMRFPAERPAAQQANSAPAKAAPPPRKPAAPASPSAGAYTPQNTHAGSPEVQSSASSEAKPQTALPSRPVAKVEAPPPDAGSDTEALKREAARLQDQLSGLLFAENAASGKANQKNASESPAETKGKVIEIARKADPAEMRPASAGPGSAPPAQKPFQPRPDLTAGEVGIPAWLEPLARNASIPAPEEPGTSIADSTEAAPAAEQSTLPAFPDTPRGDEGSNYTADISAPILGGQIFGDEHTGEFDAPAKKSGKGLLIGLLAAAAIAAAAGGAWYFKLWQPSNPQAPAGPPVFATLPSPGATTAQPASRAAAPAVIPQQPASRASNRDVTAEPLRAAPAENTPPVVNTREKERIASSRNIESRGVAARNTAERTAPAQPAEPPKKPALGDVKLAAPLLNAKELSANNVAAPHFASATPGAGDPAGTALIAEDSAGPAAPVPVGGDVKSARLLHAVPPVYPPIAKSQRIAGDVRMDALVDATGHVTAMKILSGPVLLHQAAKDAVKQWRYQPAMLDGKPVPMHLSVTVQFRLQ